LESVLRLGVEAGGVYGKKTEKPIKAPAIFKLDLK
jgi:hypothetical protein